MNKNQLTRIEIKHDEVEKPKAKLSMGPRMKKGKFSYQMINRNLYESFKLNNPEFSDLTYEQFLNIWAAITETLRFEVINNVLGVKLPFSLGELKLQYLPHKFNPVDATNSTHDELVNKPTIISRGKVGKIKWERRHAVKFNSVLQYYVYQPDYRMQKDAKNRIESDPQSIRVSRNTLGGKPNFWHEYLKRKGKPIPPPKRK